MAVNVPQNYVGLLQAMSQATGIPYNIVAAQADVESGFNAQAVSPSNAEGWLQFLPSTYDSYAAQAGVPEGSEFNPADEEKAYVVYMKSLLKQEGGDVRNALAAYNAGPGDIAAGQGYASTILNLAGSGDVTVPGNGSGSTGSTGSTTSIAFPFPGGWADPLNWPSGVLNQAGSTALKPFEEILSDIKTFGKDWAIRAGLVILGLIVLYAGLRSLTGIQASSVVQVVAPESAASEGIGKAASASRQARQRPKANS